MPPDQPDKQSRPSKRHRRSRSRSMTPSSEVIEITSEPETSSSRKHDRHETGPQVEGPRKRQKLKRDSEPPPSRTSNHQHLKEMVKTLACELKSTKQAHSVESQKQQAKLDRLSEELEILQARWDEQANGMREQEQIVETERQESQTLRRKLEDTEKIVEDLQISCQSKDEELKGKEEVIDVKQKELDDSKHLSASFKESLAETELALKGKDEVITALKKELDDSKRQYISLKESLVETQHTLNTAKRIQSDWRDKVVSSAEDLSSTKRELDEAKKDLEKATEKVDALRLINDENGYWNHKISQREGTAKNKLKSERIEKQKQLLNLGQEKDELQKRCVKLQVDLEAQEDERNQAVGSLQSKLRAARQRYSYTEPDDKVKEDFTNLESSIRQFVDTYTQPVLNVTDQELKNIWPDWSPGLRKFLACPLLYNLVFEAYIWERLLVRLFGARSEVWAGELGRSLEETLHMAADGTAQAGYKSDDYIDFQYLRSSSSSLISRLDGADFLPKFFEADCEAIISTLAKLCALQKTKIEKSMWADVMGIFKDAREFAIQLRKLKAEYTLRMHQPCPVKYKPKHGFNLVSETMTDRSPNRGGKSTGQALSVDFIVHPGLFKRGNNSGANYEVRTCLIKMGVACNASELLSKSGSSTASRSGSKPAQNTLRSGEMKQTKEGNIPSSTVNKAKKGSSISNPVSLESEEKYPQRSADPSSISSITSGSSAPKAREVAPLNSGTATGVTTRSRAPPKTDRNAHDKKSSTKSTNNHPHPTEAARGRGGGSSAKKARQSKESDPDADYIPKT